MAGWVQTGWLPTELRAEFSLSSCIFSPPPPLSVSGRLLYHGNEWSTFNSPVFAPEGANKKASLQCEPQMYYTFCNDEINTFKIQAHKISF